MNTPQARVLSSSPDQRANVVFTFRVDSIAQEGNETLTLQLTLSAGTLPDAEFIFRDTLDMIIIDSNSKTSKC